MEDLKGGAESSERSPDPVSCRLRPKQQRQVLQACTPEIHSMLDMEQVFPYLFEKNLLTDSEQDQLQSSNPHLSRKEKISKLITSLPGKGSDALSRFVECLKCPAQGTAHEELACSIEILADQILEKQQDDEVESIFRKYFQGFTFMVIALLVCCTAYKYGIFSVLSYHIHKGNSKSLPYLSDNFVGRETEIEELSNLLDFETSTKKIVNIIGSPGFGKSTLAIHIGHHMLTRGVTAVHYVNLEDFPKERIKIVLAKMILESANIQEAYTFNKLLQWTRGRALTNLIILDNCDNTLHSQKEDLQSAIEKIVESSPYIKILMTSREATMHVGSFEQYKLYELSTKAACDLLNEKVPSDITLNISEREEIAKLTGNVPLALQIVGSLLHLPDLVSPRIIITELEKDPILTLSPKLLPENRQINASFGLSFNYLSYEEKLVGVMLANFPGSFSMDASLALFQNTYSSQVIKDAMKILVQRSLLEFDRLKNHYSFHCLIREFFLEKQSTMPSYDIEQYLSNFQAFFTNLLRSISEEFYTLSLKKPLAIFDRERHNFIELLEILGKVNNAERVDTCIVISNAIEKGLLTSRFLPDELLLPVSICLRNTSFNDSQSALLQLIYHHIDLEKKVHSLKSALTLYDYYTPTIERLTRSLPNNVMYIKIQSFMGNLCAELGHFDDSIMFYKRAYKLSQKDCNFLGCSYQDLGYFLLIINDHKMAAIFLHLSLKSEEHGVLYKLTTLQLLHTAYYQLSQTDNAAGILEDTL